MKTIRAWIQVLGRPLQPFGGLSKVLKIVSLVISVGVVAAFLSLVWKETWELPVWVYAALAVALFYLVLVTFFVAMDKTHEPSCEVGVLKLDAPDKVFYLSVRNGEVRARIKVSINDATDSVQGIEHLGRSVEPCWRGRPKGHDAALEPGGKERIQLLLSANRDPSGHPSLWIVPNNGNAPIPVSRDVPLSEQGKVTLNVSFTCESVATATEGKPEVINLGSKIYSVAPDLENREVGYKIIS